MAMAGVGSKLKTWLHCAICQDVVKQPKTLTCFHSFCGECVRQLKKTSHTDKDGVNCPVCRAFTEESMVKTNFLVNELLDTHTGNQSGTSSLCEMCLKDKSGLKCVECKMFLCDSCKAPHLRVPTCRRHHIVKAGDETDVAIDRLVFCENHDDQPIMFNCRECEEPLCIKCKVTKHDKHDTETVEDTLQRVLPEITGYSEKIKVLITDIDDNKDELGIRKNDIKESFDKSRKDGETKLQRIIDRATEDYNALVKELDIREEEELDKLRLDQRNEYERLVEWMKTCCESAKGVTLMQQVQSGLCRKMKQIANLKVFEMSTTRLKLPQLITADDNSSISDNVIGRIEYKQMKILTKQKQQDSKNPEKPFKEILGRKFDVSKEVALKGRCTRVSFIHGEIWAAVPSSKCIQIVDFDGNIQREIPCDFQPYSVKEAPWGDIIVAGTTGLFLMLPDGTANATISTESFCDVTFFNDEVIGVNCTQHVLQSFCKTGDGKWKCTGDVKASKGLRNNEDTVVIDKENIFFTMNGNNVSKFHKCEGKTGDRVDLTSNQKGMNHPFLCGVDSTGDVLVADCNNKVFQVLDRQNQWTLFTIVNVSSYFPFDFLYHAETQAVWVMMHEARLIKLV